MAYEPPINYLFAPDRWDFGWRAALRNVGSSPAAVAFLGDSFTQGSPPSTDYMNLTYPALIRASLLSKYPHGGDFWAPQYSNEFYAASGGTFAGTPPYSAMAATGRALTASGYSLVLWWNPTPGTNLVTFTTPYACTDIDIISIDYTNANWTYTVDGGATQTVTVSGSTGLGNELRRTQITGLANTTHTVVITGQTATTTIMLCGFCTYKSRTSGVRVVWSAASGATTYQFVLPNFPGYGQEQIWQGRMTTSTLTGFGFPSQPNLAVIGIGINDCQNGGGFGFQAYQGALRRLCDAFRRGNADTSILFVAHSNPSGNNSDVTTPFANSRSWPDYIDRMLNIAIDYNCALVNMHAKWGVTGVAQGFQQATNPHPTDAGHADLANVMKAIL